jgi:hypothetical protein
MWLEDFYRGAYRWSSVFAVVRDFEDSRCHRAHVFFPWCPLGGLFHLVVMIVTSLVESPWTLRLSSRQDIEMATSLIPLIQFHKFSSVVLLASQLE